MPSEIGINFSALNNITAPTINIPTTFEGMVRDIPIVANELTGGKLGTFICFMTFIITYLFLSDKTPYGDYNYSDIRGLTLGSAIGSLFGIIHLMTGYITDFKIVAFFVGIHMVFQIILLIIENKE